MMLSIGHTVAASYLYTHTPWWCLPPNLHCRPHHNGIVTLTALASLLFCAGTVTLVAQALLPTMRWRHCPCRDVTIAAVTVVQVSLPLLLVQAFSPSLHWHYALAPLPLFLVVQAFSPLLPTCMASQLKSFGRLPLSSCISSCLGMRPLNGREGPPSIGTAIQSSKHTNMTL